MKETLENIRRQMSMLDKYKKKVLYRGGTRERVVSCIGTREIRSLFCRRNEISKRNLTSGVRTTNETDSERERERRRERVDPNSVADSLIFRTFIAAGENNILQSQAVTLAESKLELEKTVIGLRKEIVDTRDAYLEAERRCRALLDESCKRNESVRLARPITISHLARSKSKSGRMVLVDYTSIHVRYRSLRKNANEGEGGGGEGEGHEIARQFVVRWRIFGHL